MDKVLVGVVGVAVTLTLFYYVTSFFQAVVTSPFNQVVEALSR